MTTTSVRGWSGAADTTSTTVAVNVPIASSTLSQGGGSAKRPLMYYSDRVAQDLRIQLRPFRRVQMSGATCFFAQLLDEKTKQPILIQSHRFYHRGPSEKKEGWNNQIGPMSLSREMEPYLYEAVESIEAQVRCQLLPCLTSSPEALAAHPSMRVYVEKMVAMEERRKAGLLQQRIEAGYVGMDGGFLRPAYNDVFWLRTASDFRLFDINGRAFAPVDLDLQAGDYEMVLRASSIYIGPHGESAYVASVVFKVAQVRYIPLCFSEETVSSGLALINRSMFMAPRLDDNGDDDDHWRFLQLARPPPLLSLPPAPPPSPVSEFETPPSAKRPRRVELTTVLPAETLFKKLSECATTTTSVSKRGRRSEAQRGESRQQQQQQQVNIDEESQFF